MRMRRHLHFDDIVRARTPHSLRVPMCRPLPATPSIRRPGRRATAEGEIELRGTPAAEEGGLHMGRDGTEGVFVSATRWRKCLVRHRFTRALFVRVRLATLQPA